MRKSEIWEFLWVSMNGLQRHSIFYSTWGISFAIVFLFFCSVLLCSCCYILFCFVLFGLMTLLSLLLLCCSVLLYWTLYSFDIFDKFFFLIKNFKASKYLFFSFISFFP